jgi:GWxTD domain-containing protein
MSTPIVNAVGWTLVHFLWEGAALALILVLFGRAGARVRYAAACAALAAMPLAFAVTLYRLWPADIASGHLRIPRGQGIAFALGTGSAQGNAAASSLWTWLVVAWMAGVAVFYFRSLGGWMAARRMSHVGVAPAAPEWQARFCDLRARVGVTRAVALMESCLSEVPVVIGYLRPVILLPAGMATGLSTDQVEALLMHELAHIRRHDYLVNLLQSVIEGLLFYHPAVWWVSHVIRTEREHCCDDTVVDLRGDARGYAGALAALESLRAPEPILAASGGSLVRRVRRLLRQPEGPQGSPAALIAAVALLIGAATMLSGWQQTSQSPTAQQKQGSQPGARAADPYRKWVTEDVAYIITQEERAAFRSLGSDEEREHFIEQFWQRRNPTPGSADNPFKQEHYRRIAYANDNFTAADGLPGWKTDQGRVLITYGPPDEKESHPAAKPPYEQWLYRLIEGVGENIIVEFREENGRMQMTSDPSAAPKKLLVRVGGSEVIDTPGNIRRIKLANAQLAEAAPENPRKVRVEGKQAGATTLTIWFADGGSERYDITVQGPGR